MPPFKRALYVADLPPRALAKFAAVLAIGVMFTPLVVQADKESRAMFASMKPGSLVTRFLSKFAGPDKKPRKGISDMLRFFTALINN